MNIRLEMFNAPRKAAPGSYATLGETRIGSTPDADQEDYRTVAISAAPQLIRRSSLVPRCAVIVILFSLGLCAFLQAQTAQSLNLAWDASSDPSVAGYRVYYGATSGSYSNVVDTANNTSAAISNLVAGKSYFFAATAYNAAGTESVLSNEASAIAQPLQTGSVPAQNVDLAWAASSDSSVTGYRIHYGTESGNYTKTVDVAKNTTATISNLLAGTSYYVVAAAYNAAGIESIPSNEVEVIAQPLQTGIASVNRLSNGSVQLTILGTAGATESIYVSGDMKTWTLLKTEVNSTGTLLATDSGAATLTHRYYRVTDSSGTSAPAGFLTLSILGTTSTIPQRMSYLGLGLANPVSYIGTVSAFGTQTVTDLQSHWNTDQFNGSNGEYYLEVVSGTYSGVTSDIVGTDPATQTLKTADDLSTLLKGGESYRICHHRTIGDVFGKNDEAKLNGGTSVNTADEVQIFNPLTQTFARYYYQTGGSGGTGWRSSADSSKDASGTILYLDQGVAVCRKVSGTLKLILAGAAKTGPAVVPVEANLNLLANMYPAGTRTLGNSRLYVADPKFGLAGGASVTDADEVRIYNGTTFLSYYYQTSGSGGIGWRSSRNSSTDVSTKQIPIGASVYVVRKSGRLPFNWFVPQPF